MHKALKVKEHRRHHVPAGAVRDGATGRAEGDRHAADRRRRARGRRSTSRPSATSRTLTVTGDVDLLMTDYGIAPPKAMLGMLKTDPKVTITFETVLAIPLDVAWRTFSERHTFHDRGHAS